MSAGKYRASHSGSCAMNFSKTLIFSLLLYRRILFSEGSFLRDRSMIQEDNVLGKFFTSWIPIFEEYHVQQTVVIGKPDDQIANVGVFLKAFPSFVGSNIRNICTSRELAYNCPIFYFLSSVEEKYVTREVESFIGCNRNKLFFIFGGIVDYRDVDFVLRITFEKLALTAVFMDAGEKSVKLYAFKTAIDCSRKVELVIDWVPGDDQQSVWDFLTGNVRTGCEIFVGTMHQPPWMNLVEDGKGKVKSIDGSEADLISTIAQKMNATPRVREYRLPDGYHPKKEQPVVSGCTTGDVDICIGHIRPIPGIAYFVDISQSYAQECVVWCVPKTTYDKNSLLTSEFSWSTWLLMGLTFLVCFAIERIVQSIPRLNGENAYRSGRCRLILDMLGSTLGNPIIHRPLSVGGKFLLMSYLSYSLVMTTAYKTSLSSMLTLDNNEALINDIEGIIRANLTTGGHLFGRQILEELKGDGKFIPELLRRFVVEPNVTKALLRVSNDRDFAYLTTLTELNYHKYLLANAGEPVSVHVLHNQCWLLHNAVMVFPKSSHLSGLINSIMMSFAQSGLLLYWERKSYKEEKWISSDLLTTSEGLRELTRDKLFHVFRIYCLALFFCTFVFSGELFAHKFNFAGKLQRFENWTRVKFRKPCASLKPLRLSNRQIRTP